MEHADPARSRRRSLFERAAVVVLVLGLSSFCVAQAKPQPKPAPPKPPQAKPPEPASPPAWPPATLQKYPGLLEEVGALIVKLQNQLQFPPLRGQSRLLPLLPATTSIYGAAPNYGDVARQALQTFRQELQQNAALRQWRQDRDFAPAVSKIEAGLEQFSQVSSYLGDEIVISGSMERKEPGLLIAAEVRKPGLKAYLQQLVDQAGGTAKTGVRIFDPQGLASAQEARPASDEPVVLVRDDLVAVTASLASLRRFNTRMDQGAREFAATPFGQRVVQAYEGGASLLGAVDMQRYIGQLPLGSPDAEATFRRSGFADMQYAVWQHKNVPGQPISQSELSFIAPRHGVASWLGPPTHLGTLDFVAPDAVIAATIHLKDPAEILDDVRALMSGSKSNPFAQMAQMEQAMHISVRDDLLGQLGGEITLELDSFNQQKAEWRVVLSVRDARRLEQTLATLLTSMNIPTQQAQLEGAAYTTVLVPSGKTTTEIAYTFDGGYLVIGSSVGTAADALQLHRSGGALGRSQRLLASMPAGRSADASALLYEDPVAVAVMQMRLFAPEMAKALEHSPGNTPPIVVSAYAEPTVIRQASTSGTADAGVVAIIAAIAIPNLLRSRIAANEASAVGTLRSVNTAQIAYASAYPQRGYAPDLATLGPDPKGPGVHSADHAGLIDQTLANSTCTAGAWCQKSGFRFKVSSVCKQRPCKQYLAVATPISTGSGSRSFCSLSDGVIRWKSGSISAATPVTMSECRSWMPLM